MEWSPLTEWLSLFAGIAISVYFYEQLDRLGQQIGEAIGNVIVWLLTGRT